MKERIEKWLEDRKEVVGGMWQEEFQYMLVLVLFWGFKGLIHERAKINFVTDSEPNIDFYKDHPV